MVRGSLLESPIGDQETLSDGRIFRLREDSGIAEDRYLAAAQPLVDLKDLTFEQVRAPPAAMRWYDD